MNKPQRRSKTLRMSIPVHFLALIICLAIIQPCSSAPFLFQGLGDLPDGLFRSSATAVSVDGSVVVGTGYRAAIGPLGPYDSTEAFRWTRAGGMVGLGHLSSQYHYSEASGVSADGSIVVGGSSIDSSNSDGFRWSSGAGMVRLGGVPAGTQFDAGASGVSADGSVIVGQVSVYNSAPFRREAVMWKTGAMTRLGDLPDGNFDSVALAVSGDSLTVVGVGNIDFGQREAFRWRSDLGIVSLGDLPGGNFFSQAQAVSADGSLIVGYGNSDLGNEAFRWTEAGGMIGLGDLPGGNFRSEAHGVSADGSTIVGLSVDSSGRQAFLWHSSLGMLDLQDYLTGHGATGLASWTLTIANAISADGKTIVGQGINPNGDQEAWIATVPEPSSGALIVYATIALTLLRLRRRTCR